MKQFNGIVGRVFGLLITTAVLIPALATIAMAQAQYTISYFYQGGTSSGINDYGQVTGNGGSGVFIFSPGSGIQYLPSLGGDFNQSEGINNSGQVAGYSSTAGNALHAFIYTPGSGMTDLGTLGGSMSFGYGVNNSGQVTGYSYTTGDASLNFFIYTPGKGMQDLGLTINGSWSSGINDYGQVTGTAANGAFIYTPGSGITYLHPPYSDGVAINNSGQVTGYLYTSSDTNSLQGFLYTPGVGIQSLGAGTQGWAINNSGQVVGSFGAPGGNRAFLYSNGQMTDLNTLIDPSLGWTLISATGINDSGQITGYGVNNDTQYVFLLTPVNITSETFTDTVSSSGNGTITSSSSTVNYGGSVTFTITPSAGYTLTSLTDNGTNVTANAVWNPGQGVFTYTISNVTSNNTIQATFGTPPPASQGPALSMLASFFLTAAALGVILGVRREANA